MFRLVTAAACAALFAAPVLADAPVALVENAAGKPGVKAMELLSEGRILILQQGATVTLGYFGSCQRETITGGTVVVGPTESAVFGGSVRREKVACDGGRML